MNKKHLKMLSLSAKARLGCDRCQEYVNLKLAKGFPIADDVYCGDCGARESDVAELVRKRFGG